MKTSHYVFIRLILRITKEVLVIIGLVLVIALKLKLICSSTNGRPGQRLSRQRGVTDASPARAL